MSEYGERANELFCAGYNCCQSTFAAFCPATGLPQETALRLASGLGAGYGRQREICGAVSGMCMAAGLLFGYSDPAANEAKTTTYELIRELCAAFRAKQGSLLCRDLLGLEGAEQSAVASARTAQYYAERPCAELCRFAAELLAEEMAKRNLVKQADISCAEPERNRGAF